MTHPWITAHGTTPLEQAGSQAHSSHAPYSEPGANSSSLQLQLQALSPEELASAIARPQGAQGCELMEMVFDEVRFPSK